jgi:CBS domain containing-hemolysin-like protein
MEIAIPLLIIALLILLNSIFVAAEFGLIGAPPPRIARRAEQGETAAQLVIYTLRSPLAQNRYLATAQIGITAVSLGLGMYGEHAIAEWIYTPLARYTDLASPIAHTIATIVAVAALTYLHVVLGEMIAKSLALQFAESTALRLSLPMAILQRILSPAIFVLNGIANAVTRAMGIPPANADSRLLSPDELEYIVDESFEGGLIEEGEQIFIENIFDLKERTIGQVMTPRTRIVGLDVRTRAPEVMALVCEAQHSRYPIYDESLDDIIGVVHIKDLARHQIAQKGQDFDLRKLALHRPVLFVPDSVRLDEMLVRFRREHVSLAVVVDEFGGTAGLISLEDLVEEVVGEIRDEFDEEETAPFEQIGEYTLRVHGALLLDELNQHFEMDLEHPEVDTVGGLIMSELGRIPEAGDEVTVEGIRFVVEQVEGLAVQSVQIEMPEDLMRAMDDE